MDECTVKLAKAIVLAAKLREDSFDRTVAKMALEADELVDYEKFYQLSIEEATMEVSQELGYPIYLLLQCCWDEALTWATKVINKS